MPSLLEQSLKDRAYIERLSLRERRTLQMRWAYIQQELRYQAKCDACKD